VGEQRQRMARGDLYDPADPELVADRRRAALLLEELDAVPAGDDDARRAVLARLLGRIGAGTEVRLPLRCDYGYHIHLGERSFVNFGALILDCAPVHIGDDVQIATAVQLLTATHPLDPQERRRGLESAEAITISDGVWLGGGVIVCPGVTIGAGTVVGAGSVVTRDLPAGVLAVGNPCRVVREL
jgi:maltose O-acetyltransferase